MKYAAPLLLTAAIALLSGCSSMKVASEKTADFDFSSVKTYEWVQAPRKILNEDDTFVNENVHMALNNQLAARGWEQVMVADKADIQAVYYIKMAEHEEYAGPASDSETRVTGGFTYNKDKGNWASNDQAPDLNIYTIEVGTLTVLLYDTDSGEKIWKGTLQTRLDRQTPLDKQRKKLTKIATKIISRIPGK